MPLPTVPTKPLLLFGQLSLIITLSVLVLAKSPGRANPKLSFFSQEPRTTPSALPCIPLSYHPLQIIEASKRKHLLDHPISHLVTTAGLFLIACFHSVISVSYPLCATLPHLSSFTPSQTLLSFSHQSVTRTKFSITCTL